MTHTHLGNWRCEENRPPPERICKEEEEENKGGQKPATKDAN